MNIITEIFIIQSLKTIDIYKSGLELAQKLKGSIATTLTNVETKAELFDQIEKIKAQVTGTKAKYVIHFDCHGNEDGIGIFDKFDNSEFVIWEDFRLVFREIYTNTLTRPIISFSTCKGFNVMKLLAAFEPCPYDVITGSLIEIPFGDSVAAYFDFYTNINNGMDFAQNIKEIRDTYPKVNFIAVSSELLFLMAWEAYFKTQLTPEVLKVRKAHIIAEVEAKTKRPLTALQLAMLEKGLSQGQASEDYRRFRDKFYS